MVARVKDIRTEKELIVVTAYLKPGGILEIRKAGETLTHISNQRDTYPCRAKRHPSAPLMEHFLEENRAMETINNEDMDLTQLTRWGYVEGFLVSGARLDHILVTGYIRHEFTSSQVLVAHLSDHHIVYVDWDSGHKRQPDTKWAIKPSTIRNSNWKKELEQAIKQTNPVAMYDMDDH
ncbi:hypothetical protein DSO57_1011214 [Entomophthora muscae]|uniref:Uncharacterized protein n=1 Tax=Entomophthora muscae TaxID=34485 RepID=A0ACC2RKZ4_9FUNG|nr:hypothetical protein DSO57_1011214 [Entomophthora muscae]